MPQRILLIDGDILAYKIGFSHEENLDWGNGVKTCVVKKQEAIEALDEKIKWIRQHLDATTVAPIIFLSDETNFRKQLNPDYKANRKDKPKPQLLPILRDHITINYVSICLARLEADDAIGIYMTSPGNASNNCIDVTIDKDMLTIPGEHYYWNKDEIISQSLDQANIFFYEQVLSGDPTDGYKGVPGIGPIKAKKIIEQCAGKAHQEIWQTIVEQYEAKGLTEDDALMNARMAYILRSGDYHFTKEKIKLWKQPTAT